MRMSSKSREELLEELQKLKQEFNLIRSVHENELENFRLMEEKLKVREEQLREVLENSLDASYKRNLITGTYDYFSPVVAAITGYSPDEMNNLPLEETIHMMHPDDVANVERQVNEAILKGWEA